MYGIGCKAMAQQRHGQQWQRRAAMCSDEQRNGMELIGLARTRNAMAWLGYAQQSSGFAWTCRVTIGEGNDLQRKVSRWR